MKTLFLLLQAQAQAPAQGQPGGGASMWILLLLMFVVMYFFMIRPQRKQQKELEAFQNAFQNALKKGDKVIIGNSGIFGEIVEVDDRTALVRVDGDTKLRVAKQVLTRDTSDIQK